MLNTEKLIMLLNNLVYNHERHPFNLYAQEYIFTTSGNPDFPIEFTYKKFEQEWTLLLSLDQLFHTNSQLIEHLIDDNFLDTDRFYKEVDLVVSTDYRVTTFEDFFYQDDSLTWELFLNDIEPTKRLETFFHFLNKSALC